MKNLIVAFVFGFLTHFLFSKYFFTNPSIPTQNISHGTENSKAKPLGIAVEDSLSEQESKSDIKADSLFSEESEKKDLLSETSNCPTGIVDKDSKSLETSESLVSKTNSKKAFKKFKSLVADRKIIEMDEMDLNLMSDKALVDPDLVLIRSQNIEKFEKLKILNGVFKGHLSVFDPLTQNIKSNTALIDIEFKKSSSEKAVGKYLIEIQEIGTSSGTGGPNGFKQSPVTSDFFIQLGTDKYFQVTELDEYLKANYYVNNELSGFLKLKRIR